MKVLLWQVLVAGALVCCTLAGGAACEGSYKDYEYTVDAARIEEIRITSRVGLVVVQHAEPSGTRSPRGTASTATTTTPSSQGSTAGDEEGKEGEEETPTRPPAEIITVKTRIKATDADTISTMRVDLDSSYGILTALVVCLLHHLCCR